MAVKQTRAAKKTRAAHRASGSGRRWNSIPRAYRKLMGRFWLRPLQTDQELTEAIVVADCLASRKEPLLAEEEKYFDVLCDLIEKYEDEHVIIPDADAAEILRFLIEQRGVTQQTVALETGIANSTISAVLGGDRELTRKHIERMAAYFGVEPAVFFPG